MKKKYEEEKNRQIKLRNAWSQSSWRVAALGLQRQKFQVQAILDVQKTQTCHIRETNTKKRTRWRDAVRAGRDRAAGQRESAAKWPRKSQTPPSAPAAPQDTPVDLENGITEYPTRIRQIPVQSLIKPKPGPFCVIGNWLFPTPPPYPLANVIFGWPLRKKFPLPTENGWTSSAKDMIRFPASSRNLSGRKTSGSPQTSGFMKWWQNNGQTSVPLE